MSDDSKGILTAIQTSFTDANPAAHIEDFLSELVDWLAIANRRASRAVPDNTVTIGAATYTEKQLATAIDEIKLAIEGQISQQVDSSIHERFVQALHRPMRPGKETHGECIDYLVMNYDSLIEDALALSKVHYSIILWTMGSEYSGLPVWRFPNTGVSLYSMFEIFYLGQANLR